MNSVEIIKKYYNPKSSLYKILITHNKKVTKKALAIAKLNSDLNPDVDFISEAAMLHDIGIIQTRADDIGCSGDYPYLCHGYLGRKILEGENLPRHALVCERHVGVGLTKSEIIKLNLPIPKRDMLPLSHEEKIISLADKFFTKNPKVGDKQLTISQIRKNIARFGPEKLATLDKWLIEYKI